MTATIRTGVPFNPVVTCGECGADLRSPTTDGMAFFTESYVIAGDPVERCRHCDAARRQQRTA